MPEIMCEMCFPDGIEIGMYCDRIALMLNEGVYSLIADDGHRAHVIYEFPDKPVPDPDPECTNESPEIEAAEKHYIDLLYKVIDTLRLSPEDGHYMILKTKEDWDRYEGMYAGFLLDRCGKLVRDWEEKNKKVE